MVFFCLCFVFSLFFKLKKIKIIQSMYRKGALTSFYTYYYVMVPVYCVFHTHDHFSTHGVRGQRARYLVWKRTASHLFHGLF